MSVNNRLHRQLNNEGVTLIETLVALVIASMLLSVLTKGIITASNWRAEGEQVKWQSDKLSDAASGNKDASAVTDTKSAVTNLSLYHAESGTSIPVGSDDSLGTSADKWTYSDPEGTLEINVIKTHVPDKTGGT